MTPLSSSSIAARSWLVAKAVVPLVAVCATTTSCLISSTPEFKPPEQTPPFLLSVGADPPLGELVVLPNISSGLRFTAPVRSEDADESVSVRLYIDYGYDNGFGQPFAFQKQGKSVPAGRFDESDRRVSMEWHYAEYPVSGCHTFTLIASHEFGDDGCPVDLADSTYLTWDVIVCDATDPTCPPLLDPSIGCVPPQAKKLGCGAAP
jgi:hypothetical protein